MHEGSGLSAAGLGQTQREVLVVLKRRGPSTLGELAVGLGLSRATLRGHLQALAGRGLVARRERRRGGPGRPEMVYALNDAGETLFPRREGVVLRELAAFMVSRGLEAELETFIAGRVAARADAMRDGLAGLGGAARMHAVAEMLSREGYMAEIDPGGPDGAPVLRLCHCPIRDLVAVTDAPCRAEIALTEELLGTPLARTEYLAVGGGACSYAVRRP